jgi:hypothetical protein
MALKQTAKSRLLSAKNSGHKSGEPVSFHLEFVLGKDFVLPEGSDSVGILRSPFVHNDGKLSKENLTGTKMEFWTTKFNSSTTEYDTNGNDKLWQDRLLLITEKRIFIVTEKATVKKGETVPRAKQASFGNEKDHADSASGFNMEIVDSIPMEEILSITLDMESHPGTWSNDGMNSSRRKSLSFIQEIKTELQEIEHNLRKCRPESNTLPFHAPTRAAPSARTSRSLERSSTSRDNFERNELEPVLRILTKPGYFNRGEPYYFLLRKQDCPCVDTEDHSMPLHTRADAEALASRLASLAARRHTEHARDNRFDSLQKKLCRAWNSVAFNLLVLVLIASNFAFTVLQLENKDPNMQSFYEDVDFSYTVIFAIGIFSPLPPCSTVKSPSFTIAGHEEPENFARAADEAQSVDSVPGGQSSSSGRGSSELQ